MNIDKQALHTFARAIKVVYGEKATAEARAVARETLAQFPEEDQIRFTLLLWNREEDKRRLVIWFYLPYLFVLLGLGISVFVDKEMASRLIPIMIFFYLANFFVGAGALQRSLARWATYTEEDRLTGLYIELLSSATYSQPVSTMYRDMFVGGTEHTEWQKMAKERNQSMKQRLARLLPQRDESTAIPLSKRQSRILLQEMKWLVQRKEPLTEEDAEYLSAILTYFSRSPKPKEWERNLEAITARPVDPAETARVAANWRQVQQQANECLQRLRAQG